LTKVETLANERYTLQRRRMRRSRATDSPAATIHYCGLKLSSGSSSEFRIESQNNRANYDLVHPFNRFTRFGYLDISSIRSGILTREALICLEFSQQR